VVAFTERRAGAQVFVCEGDEAEWVRVPMGWSDRVPEPSEHRLSAEGLMALKVLVDALSSAPGRRCAPDHEDEMLVGRESPPGTDSPRVQCGIGGGSGGDGDGAGEYDAGDAGGRRR